MSRSEYTDALDYWDLIRWRGAVKSALRGRRGQAFLRELRDSLEALPEKRLAEGRFVVGGECCALGTVACNRGLDVSDWQDVYGDVDHDTVSDELNIARAMVKEIMWVNDDEGYYNDTPEDRYQRVLAWVNRNLVAATAGEGK